MSFIRRIKKNGKIYLAEVEGKRVNGKVVQRHIRYIGKEVDGETVISLSSKNIQVDSVKVYGPLLVFHSIAKKIKLPEILGKYSNEILSMVYAHCMDYKSLRNMPTWYERTDLNSILNLEGLTEGQLSSAMNRIDNKNIMSCQKEIFHNIKGKYKLDTKGVVYDLTNTYFHGKKCLIGKQGFSKDGKRKNDLIQVALATTQKEGVPVFHKIFAGNINDNRSLGSFSDDLLRYRIRPGLIIYDRGIVSKKNLISLGKSGWNTLCGLPLKVNEKKIIKKFKQNNFINNISNMTRIGKSVFYVKGVPYSFGTTKGKLVICYNEKKKLEITESRRLKLLEMQELRKENKQIDGEFEKALTPTGRIRDDILEKEEELDGYSCIFCTKNIPDKEMLQLYFDKDVVEKAFRALKGVSHLRPIRFWLKKQVETHVFICYLSYLLLSILKLDLKKKNIKITPEQAIQDLATMYNVYFTEKKKKIKFIKTVTLSKHQEKILRAVDQKLLKIHIIA